MHKKNKTDPSALEKGRRRVVRIRPATLAVPDRVCSSSREPQRARVVLPDCPIHFAVSGRVVFPTFRVLGFWCPSHGLAGRRRPQGIHQSSARVHGMGSQEVSREPDTRAATMSRSYWTMTSNVCEREGRTRWRSGILLHPQAAPEEIRFDNEI